MSRLRKPIKGVDPSLLIKDAAKLLPAPSRRLFLRGATSLGALAMLTGCDIVDGSTSENVLRVISNFNDWVQARLFSETTLAPTFAESAITRPFPFNAYYAEDEAPDVDGDNYKLEIGGLVDNKKPWTLADLNTLPEVSQITRHGLRRGLERDRLLARRPAVGFSQADRRRHHGQICLVPMRRRLFQHHRHADRAASADAIDAANSTTRPCRPPTAFRSRSASRPSSASRTPNTSPRCGCRTTTPAGIGKTAAIIGSAGFKEFCTLRKVILAQLAKASAAH